jgi:hypothetical protein
VQRDPAQQTGVQACGDEIEDHPTGNCFGNHKWAVNGL